MSMSMFNHLKPFEDEQNLFFLVSVLIFDEPDSQY